MKLKFIQTCGEPGCSMNLIPAIYFGYSDKAVWVFAVFMLGRIGFMVNFK